MLHFEKKSLLKTGGAVLAVFWTACAALAATPGALTMGECPAAAAGTHLQLIIDTVRSAKGAVTVVVYGSNPSDFLAKGKKLVKVHLPAHPGVLKGCVLLPKPGVYALAAYHDEDGDRHLSRNVVGMPTEGYAFSNNPKALLGLPSFRSVAFTAKQPVTPMPLHLRYP